MSAISLKGKVAIVTGGAQGIGEGIVRLLAARGATLVIGDIAEEAGEATAADLRGAGQEAIFVQADVASEDGWKALLAATEQAHGKADILVNNAGTVAIAPINEMAVATFDRLMTINVRSAFLGCKMVLPLLQAAGGGSIVNMSSITAMIANGMGLSAYSTSKAALRQLTKAVAIDYVQYGIRVNSVHPGCIETALTAPYLADSETRFLALGRTPLGRPGTPADVAGAIAYLVSSDAAYVTGAELVVDGGWLAC